MPASDARPSRTGAEVAALLAALDERPRRTDHHPIPRGEGVRVYLCELRGKGGSS